MGLCQRAILAFSLDCVDEFDASLKKQEAKEFFWVWKLLNGRTAEAGNMSVTRHEGNENVSILFSDI